MNMMMMVMKKKKKKKQTCEGDLLISDVRN
jgi:hypothetical protein